MGSYLHRDGDALTAVDVDDWQAPALAVVDIPTAPEMAAIAADGLVAWIAHPDLTEKGSEARRELVETLQAWRWRSMEHFGEIRKKDIPEQAIAIKTDKMQRRLLKLRHTMAKRADACQAFLLPLALSGLGDRYSGPASVLEVAIQVATYRVGKRLDGAVRETADNIRKRSWRNIKHIIHLADSFCHLNAPLPDLLARPTWVADVLRDAENRRCHLLPGLPRPIKVDETVKFMPN